MNKTLIIGGNGYIGNRLCEYFDDVDILDACWFGYDGYADVMMKDYRDMDKEFYSK